MMAGSRNQPQNDGQFDTLWMLRLLGLVLTVVYDLDLVSLEFGVALMAGYSLLVIVAIVVVSLRRC